MCKDKINMSPVMKIGDTVKMSTKNHFGNDVCADAGIEGTVSAVYPDGAFILKCSNSVLVVPMNNAYRLPRKGVWIWLNGEHIFHKRIESNPVKQNNGYLDWMCNNLKSYIHSKLNFTA